MKTQLIHARTHARSIWLANLAAPAAAGYGKQHHSSSPGLLRQMRVCGWQRQGTWLFLPLFTASHSNVGQG